MFQDFFEYRYARIPEELLKEKLTTNHNQSSSHNSSNNSEHQSQHKHKEVEPEVGSIEHQRMKLLETQVKLLSSTISALTGIDTKILKPKIGYKKTNNNRNRNKPTNRVNNRQNKSRTPNRKNSKSVVEEEEEEEEDFTISPSPIAFNHEDMDDLQQLKTDLENLDGLYTFPFLRYLSSNCYSLFELRIDLNTCFHLNFYSIHCNVVCLEG